MASQEFQQAKLNDMRFLCLKLACQWTQPDINDLETSTREIVRAADAFERFVTGTLGVIEEQSPEPKKDDAPRSIRVWVSRDKHPQHHLTFASIFANRPPVKEVRIDGAETFFANGHGVKVASQVRIPDLLGFDVDPGEVVEVEITIRKIG